MNLLSDPILHADTVEGSERLSIPGLLAGLGTGRVESLPGLQPHQRDAFHIFLCYLAGAVLVRSGKTDPAQKEAFWHAGLLDLAGGEEDAWRLLVAEAAKPAFMQPPVPTAEISAAYKPKAATPDELDVLPTAKNHDVKTRRAGVAEPEDWVYALVSLQTMAGFFGRGNYGICRMNGGFSSRPCLALRQSDSWGGIFREETLRLLSLYESRLSGVWGYRSDGLVLTWLKPWDGRSGLSLSELHPFFVECSRAVRLAEREGRILVLGSPTQVTRIRADAQKGMVGDPWIPLKSGTELTALTVSAAGFTPRLLRNLLLQDGYILQEMQIPSKAGTQGVCRLHASVLVRGQGTTDGFHQLSLPIPPKVVPRLFGGGAERDRLGRLSEEGLSSAATLQNKVMRPALHSLLQGGPEELNFGKREINAWLEESVAGFSAGWNRRFFPWLWKTIEEEDDRNALDTWIHDLYLLGWSVLEQAIARYPERKARRFRARVRAEGIYFGAFRKNFPDMKGDTR